MEKIKLNNQIVRMRKYVKQAKVHVINKLVKQVKMLQNRKGNEAQIQKAKRKAERFLEEIALLKKIKPDDISKLALSKARNWEDVLQQKNCTLYDRSTAMLVNYKAVQKEVEAFYSSNEELVLKITDLIKQWDEKNKCSEIVCGEREKEDKKVQKPHMKTNENMLNNGKNELDIIKTNNQFTSEGEKIKKNRFMNDHRSKNNKQIKLSIEPSENSDTLYEYKANSDIDAVEKTTKIRESDIHLLSNTLQTEESNNFDTPLQNTMQIEDSNMNEESGHDDDVSNTIEIRETDLNFLKNTLEIKCPNSDEDCGENIMEVENSDTDEQSGHDDFKNISDVTEVKQKIKTHENKNYVKKPQQYDISEFIKKMDSDINSSEKKSKAIALLNLDELQGLEEIPINMAEKNQSDESEEGSSEDETIETSQSKRNDPFFLGCGDEDSVAEKILPQNKDYISKDRNSTFSNFSKGSQREKNMFFERKENSNYKKNFQKFPKRDSVKFQNEKYNFKPSEKDEFMTRNYQDKFQPKSKNTFDRNNYKNQRDFKMKGKYPQSYREKKHGENSKDLYNRNGRDKVSVKWTEPHKKGNASDKPLHPSWEARRKQKELKNTSFQGKRIVFDD